MVHHRLTDASDPDTPYVTTDRLEAARPLMAHLQAPQPLSPAPSADDIGTNIEIIRGIEIEARSKAIQRTISD